MQSTYKKLLIIGLVILVAAISRLIPHPLNFAPLGAMALFGAAYLGSKGKGLLVTVLAWFLSDLVLNNFVYNVEPGFTLFTDGSFFIYLSIVLIFLLGRIVLKRVTVARMVGGSFAASIIFFVLSNFGVWAQDLIYPMTLEGLVQCYTMAIPYFKNTLVGDLFYSGVLFLAYEKLLREQLSPKKVEH
ncbi:MAG: DUF6580 family putative transport protein [Flavobacteriales bacterium]